MLEIALESPKVQYPSVYRVVCHFRKYGTIDRPHFLNGRPQILSTKGKGYVLSLLQARPSFYLDELQHALLAYQEVDASLATIARVHVLAAHSRKSIVREALERNKALRAAYQAQLGIYDESAF
ncbi:hypothetical protein RhiTH_005587 [Rhizoctonia solani]